MLWKLHRTCITVTTITTSKKNREKEKIKALKWKKYFYICFKKPNNTKYLFANAPGELLKYLID